MRLGIKFAMLFVAVLATATDAAETTVFAEISGHYEAIRQALIKNTTDDIAVQAEAIAAAATSLDKDFSVEAAGVGAGDTAAVKAFLPEVYQRAEKLATADGLTATRQKLAALTQPLARWQTFVDGPRPVVVYCPMEKKAWLQPDGAIGNPYAPSMLRCGEVVQR